MKRIFWCLIFGSLSPVYLFAQTLNDSNLPIVVIDTQGQTIRDDPRITAKMGIIWNTDGSRNRTVQNFNHYDGLITIEYRGSSSQDLFPKKPFGLDTVLPDGSSNEVSLFNFPKGHDWILYPAYNDRSLMRDVLAYDLARKMGQYATRTQYVEVILNGRYHGVHVWMEKIKRDKDRVAISKLGANENTGDALTGGYILKVDKTTGTMGYNWTSPFPVRVGSSIRTLYQVEYPDTDEITPAQKTYIKTWMTDMETALNSSAYADPEKGYAKWMDVPSLVDYVMVNEVTKNVDGYRLSAYLYKDKDSKDPRLHAGPVWDYNLTFGNANYADGADATDWVIEFNSRFQDSFYMPFWWEKIWKEAKFRNECRCRWTQLRHKTLSIKRLHEWVDSTAQVLDEAQKRNFQRWPIMGQWVWPNSFVGSSYSAEVSFLKDWLAQRINWIDANLPGTCNSVPLPEEMRTYDYSLEVYPNPVSTQVNLKFSTTVAGTATIRLYNMLGQNVQTTSHSFMSKGIHLVPLDVKHLPSGVYIGVADLNITRFQFKMVKQ